MANKPDSLHGAGVVIARAQGRGERLAQLITDAGGDAGLFPVIEIRALAAPRVPDTHPDWLVFTSVPAVDHGLAHCRRRLAPKTRIAAIGSSTAKALQDAGMTVDAVPRRQESEGLLAMAEFHAVNGAECWIVRGLGGRDLMAATLAARGARVVMVEVYERALPATPIETLLQRWREGRVDAVVVSSRSSLVNLHAMLDEEGRGFLRETQLVVPTGRMLKLAHDFHIRPSPIISADISDTAQLAALQEWWRERHQDSR